MTVQSATRALIWCNVAMCTALVVTLPWTFSVAIVVDPPTYISLVTLYLVGNFSATLGLLSRLPKRDVPLLCHTAATSLLFAVVLACAWVKTLSVNK